MNYKGILTHLYFLLVHADGNINDKEVALGKQMVKTEGIEEGVFTAELELLKSRNSMAVYRGLIENLQTLSRQRQIRAIAWLCVLANADGFMDKTEWQFIYQIYHKELNLSLEEIMKVQSELIRLTQRQRTIELLQEVA
jgi:uncharacterized tellurite resistance protein B-like protein